MWPRETYHEDLLLGYLATELLLCRIHLDLNEQTTEAHSCRCYRHIQAQRAVEDVLYFVQGLEERHIRTFWMPQDGASLTSATAFLLRSAVRSISAGEIVDGNASLNRTIRMVEALRYFPNAYSWDIAIIALLNRGACRSNGRHEAGQYDQAK